MSDVIAKEVQDLEMAPQEAFVTLYEIEVIEDTDSTGQSRTLYFHAENTEEDIKFNNGDTGSQPKIYTAFPMIMQGVESRGDGASNRPTVTIPNVESILRSGSAFDTESYPWDAENAYITGDVVTYDGKQYVRELVTTPTVNSTLPSANQTANGNGVWVLATASDLDGKNELVLEDLIGKRVTRRQTLSKYVQVGSATAPSNHFQFPKSIYVIDRISAKNPISITFELSSPFDLQNVKLPNRVVTSQYCPWVYKGWKESNTDVKSACYWKGTVRDTFTETGGTVQLAESPIMYFYTIDDEPLILHDLGTYTNANTVQDGTVSSLIFTTAHPSGGRNYGINGIAYVPSGVAGVPDMFFQSLQSGNTQTPSESSNQWRVVRVYTIWHENETYNPYIPDSRRSDYVYDKGIVYKCLKTNTNKVPGDNPNFWVQADVCGKLLSSCKRRYQVKGAKRFTLSDGNRGPDNVYNHRPNIPLSRKDRGSLSGSSVQVSSYNGTARFHGLPKNEFDNSISLPFGGFPGTRRLR